MDREVGGLMIPEITIKFYAPKGKYKNSPMLMFWTLKRVHENYGGEWTTTRWSDYGFGNYRGWSAFPLFRKGNFMCTSYWEQWIVDGKLSEISEEEAILRMME